ncbi:putative PurR-regulated permease PerM [Luteococcus japonicus]|uniref:Putative PurR-regulated permease PerM n=1 Tax=Luteococcus japonicus TaxID=33984 RepID=A0A3N1ZZA1_9ACTN|nr:MULTISPECIES: AI-2E family transporter [Luteococcus]MDN5563416.1 AI-2E family transporter [Luteococcus sp.]ROR55472.1 putative PurR-regulated permease PerM [Luteococcus japonicus]
MALRPLSREAHQDSGPKAVAVEDQSGQVITREMLAEEAATPGVVPHGIQLAAGWFWRLLVIGAGLYGIWFVLSGLSEVVIPLFVALLFTAALWPMKTWLQGRGLPRGAAAGLSLLALVALVAAIFSLVGAQIASQSSSLADASVKSYEQFMNWLASGPLQLHETQIDGWTQKGIVWAKSQQSVFTGYAAAAGAQLGHFFAGIALALFALFYFLYEGRTFARAGFSLVPKGSRSRIADACGKGWTSLVSYVRAAVIVAAVDGLGAGIGAALVGSDLFLAIGALTFITAFVPLLGAFVAGLVSTSVVLLTLGWVKALIMLGIFVAVMELEAHVLQPFLLGKAVSIHPLAVLYGLAVGTILAGVVGALFAVPMLAFANAFIRAMRSHGSHDELPADEESGHEPAAVALSEDPSTQP